MSRDQAIDFINNELLHQAEEEIHNWIYPKKKTGGYFVVSRQILCMVDFFGAVYSGYPLKERNKDPNGNRIATPKKAKKFITTFFEPKETYKPEIVEKFYDMYRNGLVHLYQPKILKFGNKGRLQWLLYRGKRHENSIELGSNKGLLTFTNVNHLEIIPNKLNQKNYLTICIDCLFEDFKAAITRYRDRLYKTKSLQTNWRTTVNAIIKPR